MLRTPQIVGPHTYNFSEEVRALKTVGGLLEVEDEKALTHAFRNFIADNKPYLNMAAKAHAYVKSQTDVTDRYLEILSPALIGTQGCCPQPAYSARICTSVNLSFG